MKTKELKELIKQAKDLHQPVLLPDNAKELLIEKFGSVVNASEAVGMGQTTLYRHLKKGSASSQFRKQYDFLLSNDLCSQTTTE